MYGPSDTAGKRALSAAIGGALGRRNEGAHRLDLRQIDAAVHEGPQGELARFRSPPPRRDERLCNMIEKRGRAYGMNFDHVLPRVGAWRSHEQTTSGSPGILRPDNRAGESPPHPRPARNLPGARLKNLLEERECRRPAQTDDTAGRTAPG